MNALTVIAPPPVPVMTISEVERVALAIAKGGLFGTNDPNAVLTLCLLAQAEGQHPAVVFRDYHVIQGKPAKKADAMLRDFINSGGKVEWHKLDDETADATFSHPAGTARIDWTIARAKKAQLTTAMWSKYPRQMLRSRVISEGVRTVYPGATSGLYVPEEVEDFTPKAEPIDATPSDERTEEARTDAPDKVVGISGIKKRLNAMMLVGNLDVTLEKFNELVHDNKADLETIKAAAHSYWTGDADYQEGGCGHEGYKRWIVRRRAELAPHEDSLAFEMLTRSLAEVETKMALQSWLRKNGDQVETLDGEESRRFEELYSTRETAIAAMDSVSV